MGCCKCERIQSKACSAKAAHQDHADTHRDPQHCGDEGDLSGLPGLVMLGEVRGLRLAAEAVAKEHRLCVKDHRNIIERPGLSAMLVHSRRTCCLKSREAMLQRRSPLECRHIL